MYLCGVKWCQGLCLQKKNECKQRRNNVSVMPFEKEIKEYEELRQKYQVSIVNKMDREEYAKYNEVLFSTHSCAIEGNSFSVDDTVLPCRECMRK